MLCPEAKRPSELATGGGGWGFGGQSWDVERYLGSTFEAWKVTVTGLEPLVGSYGLNGWLFSPPPRPGEPILRSRLPLEASTYTDVFSMRGRNAVPFLLDCVTESGAPTDDTRLPHQESQAGPARRMATIDA